MLLYPSTPVLDTPIFGNAPNLRAVLAFPLVSRSDDGSAANAAKGATHVRLREALDRGRPYGLRRRRSRR